MFKINDRIIITESGAPYYEEGDTGTVIEVSHEEKDLKVLFDKDREEWYVPFSDAAPLKKHKLFIGGNKDLNKAFKEGYKVEWLNPVTERFQSIPEFEGDGDIFRVCNPDYIFRVTYKKPIKYFYWCTLDRQFKPVEGSLDEYKAKTLVMVKDDEVSTL